MNKVLAALGAALGVAVVVLLVLVVALRAQVDDALERTAQLEQQVDALPTEVPEAASPEDVAQLRTDLRRLERLEPMCTDAQLDAFFSNLEGQQLARGYDEPSSSYFSTLYSLVYAVCGLPQGG